MNNLTENLRYLMARHDYSQQSLHRASGVSQATIRSILEQQNSPSLGVISRLSRTFGIQAWQLIGPTSLLSGLPEGADALVANYSVCDAQGRETILRVAQSLAGR